MRQNEMRREEHKWDMKEKRGQENRTGEAKEDNRGEEHRWYKTRRAEKMQYEKRRAQTRWDQMRQEENTDDTIE